MIYKWAFILVVIGTLYILLMGCTTTDVQEEDNTNDLIEIKDEEIRKKDDRIIELLENDKYLRKQKELAEERMQGLQKNYNKLFGDATACYWANECYYYEESCVEHFKDAFTNWTAREIHVHFSDQCETMIRDWEEYLEYDTSVE